jgi:hypothetical protein
MRHYRRRETLLFSECRLPVCATRLGWACMALCSMQDVPWRMEVPPDPARTSFTAQKSNIPQGQSPMPCSGPHAAGRTATSRLMVAHRTASWTGSENRSDTPRGSEGARRGCVAAICAPRGGPHRPHGAVWRVLPLGGLASSSSGFGPSWS